MALTLPRHRRPAASDRTSPAPEDFYSKEDKGRKEGGVQDEGGLRWQLPLLALGVLRHMSASSNIIHDCDEVFNYWEPLHYLLYKSGFQTWEYSSEFALRSYIYLLFHMLVAGPASFFYKAEKALSVYADFYHYGRWTSSIFNLLKYNVLGGGESHLYGVEDPTFYLKNGFNNF